MKLNKKDIAHLLGAQGMEQARSVNAQLKSNASTFNASPNLIDVAPLIAVSKIVKEEKYSKYPFADLVPTVVGNELKGNFGKLIFTETRHSQGFASGIVGRSTKESNLERVDTGLTAQQKAPETWVKTIDYSIAEIAELNGLADYSLAERKERARKMEWDEGLLQLALTGIPGIDGLNGLFNLPNVTVNTTVLTKSLADMTPQELATAAREIGTTYQLQNKYKGMPTKFAIDMLVYSALAEPYNVNGVATETKLVVFQRILGTAIGNPNIEVVGAPARDYSDSSVAHDFYVVFPYDTNTINFDVNCDYTPTAFFSKDGFHFTNSAFGQFYGVHAERPSEVMSFRAPIPTT